MNDYLVLATGTNMGCRQFPTTSEVRTMLAHEVKSKDETIRVVRTACFLDMVFLFCSEEAFDRVESLNR